MKAVLTDRETKYTTNHRKEGKCFLETFSVFDLARIGDDVGKYGQLYSPIEARIYNTGGERVYCCLWITGYMLINRQGSGYAGGYGYDKKSAALAYAINNAGIDLDTDISGVGESAMIEALIAIGKACGMKRPVVFRSNA